MTVNGIYMQVNGNRTTDSFLGMRVNGVKSGGSFEQQTKFESSHFPPFERLDFFGLGCSAASGSSAALALDFALFFLGLVPSSGGGESSTS